MRNNLSWLTVLSIGVMISAVGCKTKPSKQSEEKITQIVPKKVEYSYTELNGIGIEDNLTRRDPSDVIYSNGKYYVWYTKTDRTFSGYDASVWYATSEDGINWEERGEAIPRGDKGSWDSYSVFTPNVLKADEKYYLYYTGVKPTPGNDKGIFENNSTNDFTAIGIVVSDSPDGPFERVSEQPILKTSNDSADFDSYRVDDSCLLYRDNQYWLYYKGRSKQFGDVGPRHTKMGVAFSDNPLGPYTKYENNPLTDGGHEVMVWPYKEGVMTMLSEHGKDGRTLQYASDGINFSVIGDVGEDYPRAPGYFRFDDFEDSEIQNDEISWGISMFYGDVSNNIWPYLRRYDIEITDTLK